MPYMPLIFCTVQHIEKKLCSLLDVEGDYSALVGVIIWSFTAPANILYGLIENIKGIGGRKTGGVAVFGSYGKIQENF